MFSKFKQESYILTTIHSDTRVPFCVRYLFLIWNRGFYRLLLEQNWSLYIYISKSWKGIAQLNSYKNSTITGAAKAGWADGHGRVKVIQTKMWFIHFVIIKIYIESEPSLSFGNAPYSIDLRWNCKVLQSEHTAWMRFVLHYEEFAFQRVAQSISHWIFSPTVPKYAKKSK